MNHVKVFATLACVAIGFLFTGKVPSLMATDLPDIGLVETEPVPEGKADILVVYSASWCGPCVAMRPQWTLLRSQGYKVVYIDVDEPHKYDDKYPGQTEEFVAKVSKSLPPRVPHVKYWNSDKEEFLKAFHVGYVSPNKIKETLWKPSSSTGLVPELLR